MMKHYSKIGLALCVATISMVFASCNNSNIKGKVICDHVIELPVVTEIDYELGLQKDKEHCGHGFGCSVASKITDNGEMLVGRSLDFFYSETPCYVIRTNVPGFYKTVGLAHNPLSGSTFDEAKKNGISKEELAGLIFFSTDVLNEKGFYIEGNMRPSQPASTGIAPSISTNPDADVTLSIVAFIRYVGERAANVNEALEIAKSVNMHGLMSETFTWGGAFFMADTTGHHGVLELVDNKLIWLDMQDLQTNYYLNKDYKDKAVIGSGVGRYAVIEKGLPSVKNEADMENLMKKVRYAQLFHPETSEFDVRSEFCADETDENGNLLSIQYLTDDKNYDSIMAHIKETMAESAKKSLKELRAERVEWYSSYQTIVNCNKKTIHAIFYEDDNLTYDFGINE